MKLKLLFIFMVLLLHSFAFGQLNEDFESGFSYFDNAAGNDVDWVMNTSIYHGGTQSAHNAYTANNENILHETGILDLSATTSAILTFWHIAKTEGGYDKCYIEISTNSGSSYAALPAGTYQGTGSGYASAGYFDEDDYAEWGTSTETPDNTWWKKETFNLSSYNVSNVRFRFRLTSDGSVQRAGWYLDDILVEEPACPAPSDLVEGNYTTTGADLGWTDASGSHWDLYIVPAGDPAPDAGATPTENDYTSTSYTWSGGSPNTDYDWYVRSDCGQDNTDVSFWTGPNTFTTECGINSTYPWTEDFEGDFLPDCWSKIVYYGNDITKGYTNHTPGGNSSAKFDVQSFASNFNQYLFTQQQTISVDNTTLSFWHKKFLSSDELFEWGIATTNDPDDYTWTEVTLSFTDWQESFVDLSPYIGQDVFIAWHHYHDGINNSYTWLDDVTINSACAAPSNLTESNLTTAGADLSWYDIIGSYWDIYIVPKGDPAPTSSSTPTVNDITDNPYTWTGGSVGTSYDWYVRSDCGQDNSEVSTWKGPGTFITVCDPATLPYFESFESAPSPAFPVCMTVENTNTDDYYWLTSGGIAYIAVYGTIEVDDWFFTQGLQLTSGVTYEVSFDYQSIDDDPINLDIDWGISASSVAMSGSPIFSEVINFINSRTAGYGTFSPSTSGTYYLGFHLHSPSQNGISFTVDNVQVIEVVPSTNWTGGVDNKWNTVGNWSNGLPASSTDVTISSGSTNYPTFTYPIICGSLLIESGPGGDASILNDNLLTVNGDVTVKRYISGGKWHNVSAPVQNQTVNSLYQGGNPEVWLRNYNESTNTSTYITDLTTPMPSGFGYEVWVETGSRYDVTAEFIGDLRKTNLDITYQSTPPLSYSGPDPLGYNLVGNPFASPLDWDIGSWIRNNIGGACWIWDPVAGNYLTRVGGAGSLPDGIIPMGQGFFIQTTSQFPFLRIPINARVHSGQPFLKSSNDEELELMSLQVNYGQMRDELTIVFINDATIFYDNEHDARKMFSIVNNAPSLYAIEENEELSVNGLPLLNGSERAVEVRFIAGEDGEYIMNANLDQLTGTKVILEDIQDSNVQNLNDNPVYLFAGSTDDLPERFLLHFSQNFIDIKPSGVETLVKTYTYDGNIYIRSNGSAANEQKEVWVYDMLGKNVIQTSLSPSSLSRIPAHSAKGYLVVKVICESGTEVTKVFNY